MSAYGAAQHGKEEVRKELGLIALAHRGTFVHQSSQASASHLIGGVLAGLRSRRPAIFNLYTPCPVEHALPDEWAPQSARLALESRAFPFMTYDPDGGDSFADCLNLMGNPAIDDQWPTYELEYVDEDGEEQRMELPLTIADWAATEARFAKHFRPLPTDADDEELVPFHEMIDLPVDERAGLSAFIYTLDDDRKLQRTSVSDEIIELAEDRLQFWSQLRQLGGYEVPEMARDEWEREMEAEFEQRTGALREEYKARLVELETTYPRIVARRIAEGLLRTGNGARTVSDLMAEAEAATDLEPITLTGLAVAPAPPATVAPAAPAETITAAPAVEVLPEVEEEEEEELGIEPYIETARCTTCNECTNLNPKLFAYNENKQAYIKDAKAGTFAQIVMAAELCPADIIHPGTPLNPKEKDLDKWIERAKPYS
jgi:pyruvate-ferredoxin/flavodoxin oxidoreductase